MIRRFGIVLFCLFVCLFLFVYFFFVSHFPKDSRLLLDVSVFGSCGEFVISKHVFVVVLNRIFYRFIVYVSQLNPLVAPQIKQQKVSTGNTTVMRMVSV